VFTFPAENIFLFAEITYITYVNIHGMPLPEDSFPNCTTTGAMTRKKNAGSNEKNEV